MHASKALSTNQVVAGVCTRLYLPGRSLRHSRPRTPLTNVPWVWCPSPRPLTHAVSEGACAPYAAAVAKRRRAASLRFNVFWIARAPSSTLPAERRCA